MAQRRRFRHVRGVVFHAVLIVLIPSVALALCAMLDVSGALSGDLICATRAVCGVFVLVVIWFRLLSSPGEQASRSCFVASCRYSLVAKPPFCKSWW